MCDKMVIFDLLVACLRWFFYNDLIILYRHIQNYCVVLSTLNLFKCSIKM